MKFLKMIAAAALVAMLSTTSFAAGKADTLILQTKTGNIEIELLPEVAPNHVQRLKELSNSGFYDGLTFHRVIDGFMAQTGDPKGNGTGGSDRPDLRSEFSNVPFERGTLGMARARSPHSANSQFFIMFNPAPHLNGQYTVFGRVTSGMEHVDSIKKGSSAQNGAVRDPDTILRMRTGDQF